MNEILVRIDITSPTGRKIVRELEKHKRTVKVEYPLPESISGVTYSHEEVWKELEDKFNEHYKTNYKFKL